MLNTELSLKLKEVNRYTPEDYSSGLSVRVSRRSEHMRKNTLRVLSSVMCLILLATLVFQEPLMAATQTIPVRVGGEVLNVTPGQWVSVRSGTQITHYNVRFVNGRT